MQRGFLLSELNNREFLSQYRSLNREQNIAVYRHRTATKERDSGSSIRALCCQRYF